MNKSQIDSDKLQGIIRNPFALYFPIQRASLNYLSDVFASVVKNPLQALVYRRDGLNGVMENPCEISKPVIHLMNLFDQE